MNKRPSPSRNSTNAGFTAFFPPLLVVMLAVTIAAIWVLLPKELVRLGKSLAATSLFLSNVEFYLESGYFDAESAAKPLLHTWFAGDCKNNTTYSGRLS